MKITNKTRWSTKDLTALVKAVAQRELPPAKRRVAQIEIRRSREYMSGRGVVNGSRSWIWLWNPDEDIQELDFEHRVTLAGIIAHEFAHNRGNRGEHWMRTNPRFGRRLTEAQREQKLKLYAWVADFPVRVETPPSKPQKTDAGKVRRLQERLDGWETKRRRAENAIKKIKKSLRYYERKAVKADTSK